MTQSTPRYAAADLLAFACQLLVAAGMPEDKAQAVSGILIEGDLLGHTTHGLQLLPSYLKEVESGSMCVQGAPEVISESPATLTWHGRRLPGPWLVLQAMQAAAEKAGRCGTGTVVIRRSHHIACLAAFHQRATEQGLMMILASSDANSCSVAPFGGLDPVFTPNPISIGIPTSGAPIVTDISTSATTNGLTNRLHQEGGRPAGAVGDRRPRPADRRPLGAFPGAPGTILPLGGLDSATRATGCRSRWRRSPAAWRLRAAPTRSRAGAPPCSCRSSTPRPSPAATAFVRQMDEVARRCHARARRSRPAGAAARRKGLRAHGAAARAGVALHPAC